MVGLFETEFGFSGYVINKSVWMVRFEMQKGSLSMVHRILDCKE